jgi:hypothetical protein
MPWIEIELSPRIEWNEDGLEDWTLALGAFFTERGICLKPKSRRFPGYNVVEFSEADIGQISLSNAERLVILNRFSIKENIEYDFARFLLLFAAQMGAVGICVFNAGPTERSYWSKLGGIIQPDRVSLEGAVCREKVAIKQLTKFSLVVTYMGKPVLCLEPIMCNAHAPGVVSLAQRRLEKKYGGTPLGFASRLAVHCPWNITMNNGVISCLTADSRPLIYWKTLLLDI